ncbi:DOPA 4,5-dioxygenase family protein [Endozoicomonas sp. SCSIO W0465]|uniref:DOPA 4,5-dioxygenase family protein n=1 Tax=Endozoicomonas sp. SCSIO W0465 TaxID=2918516 RepID=UPI002075B288|nr:DOPA 4,5-dioxygenase family protein [Endozoicomonas sp. SCSIO W0465]USE37098.1 DUF924 domain-containing protein [Endozoicomonas sp. SCSIO W0465]
MRLFYGEIIGLFSLIFILTLDFPALAEEGSWSSNYKNPDYFTANNNTPDISDQNHTIITPDDKSLKGFIFEVNNHHPDIDIDFIKIPYSQYFSRFGIQTKDVLSSHDTHIFYLLKTENDPLFYSNFSRVISWYLLNRRDSSVVVRPIIDDEGLMPQRVLVMDRSQVMVGDTGAEFRDPEEVIIDGYHIHMDYLAGQEQQAKLLFDRFREYIAGERLIYSDLDWYPARSNGPHVRAGWEIKFERAGSQLMYDYGKAMIWLVLNHGDIPIYSHSKNWVFGENENRLISHLDHAWYSGFRPNLNQRFFYDPGNKKSGLYRWDQQLPGSRFLSAAAIQSKQQEILDFWFADGMETKWFKKQSANSDLLDQEIEERFMKDLVLLANGFYDNWLTSPKGQLAYIILADQFPRSIYRGTPMILAYDNLSLRVARTAIQSGEDRQLNYYERLFLYLPLVHSESVDDQTLALSLFQKLTEEVPDDLKPKFEVHYKQALKHKAVIDQFSRFIHRDRIFGKSSTEEEIEFIRKIDAEF